MCEGLLGEEHCFCPGQPTGSPFRRGLPVLLAAVGGLGAEGGRPGLGGEGWPHARGGAVGGDRRGAGAPGTGDRAVVLGRMVQAGWRLKDRRGRAAAQRPLCTVCEVPGLRLQKSLEGLRMGVGGGMLALEADGCCEDLRGAVGCGLLKTTRPDALLLK